MGKWVREFLHFDDYWEIKSGEILRKTYSPTLSHQFAPKNINSFMLSTHALTIHSSCGFENNIYAVSIQN